MKKIGILTINDNANYGNRLQNYALEYFLSNNGFDTRTIWQLNHSCIHKLLSKGKDLFLNSNYRKRKVKFSKFNKKYLKIKDYKIRNLKKISQYYDYFVVGSDQVWNYNYNCFSDEYFLKFSPKEKNISYAASFGFSEMPLDKKKTYVDGLNNFKSISVREEQSVKLLKDINLDSTFVLDPTLLLSKSEWLKLEKKPNNFINKKYIVKCFLGEIPNEFIKDINLFIKENNFEIIDINDFSNTKNSTYSPDELLYVLEHAEYIFTNSFHISVFSIIFDKQFFVYDKKSKNDKGMNTRIDSLLKIFNITNNRNCNLNSIKNEKINNNDHEKYNKLLKISRDFLLDNLK